MSNEQIKKLVDKYKVIRGLDIDLKISKEDFAKFYDLAQDYLGVKGLEEKRETSRGDRIYNGLPSKLMNDVYDQLIARDETITNRKDWATLSLYLARACGVVEKNNIRQAKLLIVKRLGEVEDTIFDWVEKNKSFMMSNSLWSKSLAQAIKSLFIKEEK